ncbi:amastin-like protein [Strigomonas culicis]|uniref:Amastin-like protein n=1 Tax=Strigomonas culicis TaxID=28005 RepID=S9UQQ9_9TRYP|nr:amastin-like protein [Strigomonas culicis]|eukprot:EPY31099.1 amastin-like protein [Strigomonas culicis]
MCCKESRVSSITYVVLEFIILILILFGTAFDQYRLKSQNSNGSVAAVVENAFNNGNCVTLWGAKQQCYTGGYSLNGTKAFWDNCPERQRQFRAAEVLSIASVGLVALSVVCGILFLCCCTCVRYFLFVLGLLNFATLCVTWALVVDGFIGAQDSDGVVRASQDANDTLTCAAMNSQDYRYGVGFCLLVAGWGLQFFNGIILIAC